MPPSTHSRKMPFPPPLRPPSSRPSPRLLAYSPSLQAQRLKPRDSEWSAVCTLCPHRGKQRDSPASARPFHLLVCFQRSCHSCSPLARPTAQNFNTQHPTALRRAPPTQSTKVPGGGGASRRGDLPTSTDRAGRSRAHTSLTSISQNPQAPAARGGRPETRVPHRYPDPSTHPRPPPPQPRTGLLGDSHQPPHSLARCLYFCLLATWPSSLRGPAPNVYFTMSRNS